MTDTLPAVGLLADLAAQLLWRDQAACNDTPDAGTVFFPTRGEDATRAKAICAGCPVIDDCREYALTRVIREGIFGGMSEHERRHERHQRRRQAAGLDRLPDRVVDAVALAEQRIGVALPEAYRAKALWPTARAPRRLVVGDDTAGSLRSVIDAARGQAS